MDRDAFIAFLKKQTNSEELVKALEAIEAGYQEEIGKRNNEAKNKRTEAKTALEDLKKTKDRFEQLCDAVGVDFDAEDFEEALEAAKKNKSNDPVLLKKIERLEKKLKDQETDFNTQLEGERGKRLDSAKKTALIDALTKHNAADPSGMLKMFMGDVEVAEDGETLTLKNDKGVAVKIEDGVKEWLSTRAWAVKNNGKPGAGSGSDPSAGGEGDEGDKFVQGLAAAGKNSVDAAAKANDFYFGGNK